MMRRVQILIVDDHPAMAYGTKMILEAMPDVQVCGIAGTGEKGLALASAEHPDIVFLDFNLPDMSGGEAAVKLRELLPDAHIVIFSGIDIIPMFNNLVNLRVSGIVSKDSSEEQIKNVVRCLLEDQAVIPIELFHQMALTGNEGPGNKLTEEEEHIMELVLKGATNEQIAEDVHMSKRSVDNYMRKIYDKFGVKSRAQAVEKYMQSKR